MAAVTEVDLYNAIQLKMMTAAETLNAVDFTATGAPSWEGSTTAFPNGRNKKFLDFNGTSQYLSADPSLVIDEDAGIISVWVKPDFNQAHAAPRYITCMASSLYPFSDTRDIGFNPGIDDWRVQVKANGVGLYTDTVGETWSANDVLHMVLMWEKTAGLDNSKSMSFYVNNVLKATLTTTFTPNNALDTLRIAAFCSTITYYYWDGGIFDWAAIDYTTLAATYTDAEIVQSLYSNVLEGGSTHKFTYELAAPPVATPGLTIAGRKVRIQTDSTTALEVDDSQDIDIAGDLDAVGTITAEHLHSTDDITADDDITGERIIGTTDALFGGTLGLQSAQIIDSGGTINIGTGITTLGDGGTTNYAAFAADGELTLNGTARIDKALWINADGFKIPGTKPASLVDYGIASAWEFTDGTDDTLYARFKLPDDMDKSIGVTLLIGWGTPTANAGNCRWQIEYLYRQANEAMDAAADATLVDNFSASATAKGLVLSSIGTTAVPHANDVCITLRIKRRADEVADTLGEANHLYGLCLTYTANKLGTAT